MDKHRQKHFENFFRYCIFCFDEFTNQQLYQVHLDEHLVHSFPCIYCDRYFLKKQFCENHIRDQHPGRKRKIKRIKPQSILDRIDKYPDYNSKLNQVNSTRSSTNTQEFIVKILLQSKDGSNIASPEIEENEEENCVQNEMPTVTTQEVTNCNETSNCENCIVEIEVMPNRVSESLIVESADTALV